MPAKIDVKALPTALDLTAHLPSPAAERAALAVIERDRPIIAALISEARHVAFREPLPIPRFVA